MKLINSKTEHEIREELLKSNEWLYDSQKGRRVREILESINGEVNSVYMLHWHSGQAEEIYSLLVNGKVIVSFELDRFDFFDATPDEISITDIKIYRQYLKGRSANLKLLIAEKLSEKDLSEKS